MGSADKSINYVKYRFHVIRITGPTDARKCAKIHHFKLPFNRKERCNSILLPQIHVHLRISNSRINFVSTRKILIVRLLEQTHVHCYLLSLATNDAVNSRVKLSCTGAPIWRCHRIETGILLHAHRGQLRVAPASSVGLFWIPCVKYGLTVNLTRLHRAHPFTSLIVCIPQTYSSPY